MSAPTNPPPGLRERKKIKLRRAIQTTALRLFETQGYEHTTVEQIAEAAETSTTTFYRYFPTKEDVVLDNDASPLFEVAVATRPAGESLTATIRAWRRSWPQPKPTVTKRSPGCGLSRPSRPSQPVTPAKSAGPSTC